ELIKLDLNIGLSLLKVGIDDATVGVTVALPDLDDILLATAVSSEGLVTIDLSTGTIAVDLPKLVKGPDAQDLNGLAPNTSVLTDDTIERAGDAAARHRARTDRRPSQPAPRGSGRRGRGHAGGCCRRGAQASRAGARRRAEPDREDHDQRAADGRADQRDGW